MKTIDLSFPELAFIAATRGMAGAGLGLLLADGVDAKTRKTLGWTLLAIGVATTLPIAMAVISRRTARER